MVALNLFRKSKPQDERPSPDAVEPESFSSVSSEEDAKLLESQIEAIERVTEGAEEKQKTEEKQGEEPVAAQEEQHAGEAEREPQDVAREPEVEKTPPAASVAPQETLPETAETPHGEVPEFEEEPSLPSREKREIEKPYMGAEESIPLPPTAEKIQEEADALSQEFEGEKGDTSRFLRVGLIGLLAAIIIGGGVFAYLRFFGGVSSLSFLQNIPFVGTYFGAKDVEVGGPLVPPAALESTPAPSPEPVPAVVSQEAERDNQRIADIDNLSTQLAAYYAAGGSYPSTGGETEKIISGAIELSIYEALVPGYISILPVDPNPQFYYGYTSDGSSYELTSVLENQDHPECVLAGNYCVRKIRDGEVVSTK